jgi:CubicO group peptidase (beta-lactamase class C family)
VKNLISSALPRFRELLFEKGVHTKYEQARDLQLRISFQLLISGGTMLRCVLAILLLAVTGLAQDISRMDKAVQSVVASKQFMGSVLVARGDQVLFSKGYGFANLEWNIPNATDTKFRIGSMSKQFTAAAILLLEEQGKVKVGDPIRKYLPEEPAAWDKVTIYHLLTHTSGIVDLLNTPGIQNMIPLPQTPEQLIAIVRDKPLQFEPGTKFQYSSSGYNLLGCLIEKVSGQRYQDFIKKNIFMPLGMKDSGYDTNIDILPKRASGYSPGPKGPENAQYVHMSNTYSAGGLYSTSEDLLRWEQGLFGGKILTPESLSKMTAPNLNGYAFGIYVGTAKGRRRIIHEGGVPGFNSCMVYFPETKITISVLSNMFRPEVAGEIVALLSDLAHGDKVIFTSELNAIAVSSKILESYVGTYKIPSRGNMRIDMENGNLVLRTGQLMGYVNTTVLSASSETYFFSKEAGVQLEFTKDKGTTTHIVQHRIGDDDLKGLRISVTASARPHLPRETLEQYAGVYKLPPGFELVFTVENDKLMLHRTWQFLRYRAVPESENRFSLGELEDTFEFVKDMAGTVTHLILRNGNSEIKAPRTLEIAEIDGAWAGTDLIYIFRAEGNTLAGNFASKAGEGWISEGKIEGQSISFILNIGASAIRTNANISGDLINMTQTNDNGTSTFTVRRVRPKMKATR